MAVDKSLVSGSTMMLILKLLEEKDMYGYEMIETLREKSENVFELKAGTLYPSWTGGKGVCKVLRAGSGWKDKKVLFHNKRRKEATPGKRKRMERIRRSSEKCSGRCMLWIDRNI